MTSITHTPAPLTLTDRLIEMAAETERKEERESAEKRVKEARAIWTILEKKTRELRERLDR